MTVAWVIIWIATAVGLGWIVGTIAESKGRPFEGWWFYGTLLFIVAIVHVLLVKPTGGALERFWAKRGKAKCPSCAEWIKSEAKACRYCGRDVVA